MTLLQPLRYTPDLETIDPDEGETIAKLNDSFDVILETTSEDYGHAVRAVHAKAHAVLEATMTIEEGLPPELAQGLFATPGEHKLLMRMSTNAGDILPDAIGLPRGVALKVLDVEGERLPGAEGRTQDFILVNGPTFVAKKASQFLQNLKLLAKSTDTATGGKVVFSKVMQGLNTALEAVGVESSMVKNMGGAPNVDPLGETYFSVTPFRYGDHVAKFQLAPVSAQLTARTGNVIYADDDPDAIRTTVREEMPGIDATWEFRVQLARDADKQPVEDPTVEWKEDEAPFVTVATIRAAPQDSWDAAKVRQIDEELRFSIWTGLAAHRPLGNINRARNETYVHSAQFRGRVNGCPMREPG